MFRYTDPVGSRSVSYGNTIVSRRFYINIVWDRAALGNYLEVCCGRYDIPCKFAPGCTDHGIRIPYQFDEFLLISVTVVRISEPYTADLIHQQMEFTYFAFDYDDIIHIKTSGSFIYTALKISIKAKLVIVRQRGYIIHQNRHRCTLFPLF